MILHILLAAFMHVAPAPPDDHADELRDLLSRVERLQAGLEATRVELAALILRLDPHTRPPADEPPPTTRPPADPPTTRPDPDPPTRPPPADAPWTSVGGAEILHEHHDGLDWWVAIHPTPHEVALLDGPGLDPYPMRPRSAACVVQGDVAAWARRQAVRAWGAESRIPEEHRSWVADQQASSVPQRIGGYVVAWADDASGRAGGGQGIPPYSLSWMENARALEIAARELEGAWTREGIHALWDTEYTAEPLSWQRDDRFVAYIPYPPPIDQQQTHERDYWAQVVPLPVHADHLLHAYRPHDWAHGHRAWRAAILLARHVPDLQIARDFLRAYWRDTEHILGWHIEEGAWGGNTHKLPLWKRMELTRQNGYGGWMGRQWAHVTRFALDLVEIGMGGDPDEVGTPAHFVAQMKVAIREAWLHHPFATYPGARYTLQWGGGQIHNNMPDGMKALGDWVAMLEVQGIWVRELRRLGFLNEAAALAGWTGPHPHWILLVQQERVPGWERRTHLRFGQGGWHDPYLNDGNEHRIPLVWLTSHPSLVDVEELLGWARGWHGLKDHPLAYYGTPWQN